MAASMWICVAALVLASAGLGHSRSLPAARDQGQLPPVPGYIPVYIQSGDSPPDVQRLYESHRTLASQGHVPQ
ncbi:uncharacterized protein LOC117649586 [Thrips palmi]|uniref:Uncharacterized protein LOC117649586 n=1 Tax=Thrips palmi TaxID=161013 RepID=A0A6P8ZT05_THRPL|nr:uncharacterized protein LOC117649586 [Thrips palmi]